MARSARPRFLVARRDETGVFHRVSHTGLVFGSEACHPLVEGMTEDAHLAICRAARWMFSEALRPQFVDLEMDGHWRVSPLPEEGPGPLVTVNG